MRRMHRFSRDGVVELLKPQPTKCQTRLHSCNGNTHTHTHTHTHRDIIINVNKCNNKYGLTYFVNF